MIDFTGENGEFPGLKARTFNIILQLFSMGSIFYEAGRKRNKKTCPAQGLAGI